MSSLGELLKNLRGNRSLREIAEITGLSHTYIADVEKGYRRGTKTFINPSPDTLKRFADAYNYPYETLLEKAGYLQNHNEELTDKKEILAFINYLKNHPESEIFWKSYMNAPEEKKKKLQKFWKEFVFDE